MSHTIFKEQQKFIAWEGVAIAGALIAGLVYRFIDQEFIHPSSGGVSLFVYLIFLTALTGLLISLLLPKVSVKITNKEIQLKYFPWQSHSKKIKWEDVQACEIVKTPLLAQLNGWNINFDHSHNYTACGRNGLHLVTKDGTNFFIGSKKLKKLEKTVQKVIA